MKNVILGLLAMVCSQLLFAQDSLQQVSPLKFISSQNYQYYKNGGNSDLYLIAEVNNYPSPGSVLQLAKELSLTTDQKHQVNMIHIELNRKVKEMGGFLIKEQTKLNQLFETRKIDEGSLIYYTNKIGALEGELRNAYLRAHLRTSTLLSAQQLKKYQDINNKGK